jgi:hypothetical protein
MEAGDTLTIYAVRPNGWYEVTHPKGHSFLARHRELAPANA